MSDQTLVERARAGDMRALAELWRRHYRSGVRVARQYTSVDVDDVVADAFIHCFTRKLASRGLTGAFRASFYASIRLVARGRAGAEVAASSAALARTLTARAYESLPARWREALWYLEIEGLDPHEAAPLLGMTTNATADLSFRARAGMRGAWLRTYSADAAADGHGECEWVVARLESFSGQTLSAVDCDRLTVHLARCARCATINRQVADVPSRLALVLIPLVLGPDVGGQYLGLFGKAHTKAAVIDDIPPMPAFAVLEA